MGHFPVELLDDLGDVLAEVRGWAGVKERGPGVFYMRREPFLHFHLLKGGRRRGDIKGSSGWVSLDLPRPISATRRQMLRRALRAHYREKRGDA
jgi:hypothetical protein